MDEPTLDRILGEYKLEYAGNRATHFVHVTRTLSQTGQEGYLRTYVELLNEFHEFRDQEFAVDAAGERNLIPSKKYIKDEYKRLRGTELHI